MAHSIKAKVMLAAAASIGGRRRLRDALGISSQVLHAWLSGSAEPSEAMFLKALSVLIDELERRERSTPNR